MIMNQLGPTNTMPRCPQQVVEIDEQEFHFYEKPTTLEKLFCPIKFALLHFFILIVILHSFLTFILRVFPARPQKVWTQYVLYCQLMDHISLLQKVMNVVKTIYGVKK